MLERALEAAAFAELEHEVGLAILLAYAMELDQVRMGSGGQSADLPLQRFGDVLPGQHRQIFARMVEVNLLERHGFAIPHAAIDLAKGATGEVGADVEVIGAQQRDAGKESALRFGFDRRLGLLHRAGRGRGGVGRAGIAIDVGHGFVIAECLAVGFAAAAVFVLGVRIALLLSRAVSLRMAGMVFLALAIGLAPVLLDGFSSW